MTIALTLDIDWAPDHVIDEVAGRLVGAGVRATWFVTHASPAVDRLRDHPELFELGIHPNFLPGSSHGASVDDVLRSCMTLVPDARAMRTHSLVQSTPILTRVVEVTPIDVDVSLHLPGHPGLVPVEQAPPAPPMRPIPFWWEDDYEMYRPVPDWSLDRRLDATDGLRVLNFHPIHVVLNSASLDGYAALKRAAPRLQEATVAQVAGARNAHGAGTGTAFDAVVSRLAGESGGVLIRDIGVMAGTAA